MLLMLRSSYNLLTKLRSLYKVLTLLWKKLFLKKIGRKKCQTHIRFRRTIFTLGRTMSDVRPLF